MKTFTEHTYTDGIVEVMVHHRTSDGKIVRIYTYAKDASDLDACETESGKPMKPFNWQPGRNALFVDLPAGAIRRFVRDFIDSGELVCTELEEAA